MNKIKALCIYCGSSRGNNPVFTHAARLVGETLAKRGIKLVFGGGRVGLMGVAADACLAIGGKVVGVIPKQLMDKEIGHNGLSELHIVANMHERKAMLTELSDGFVVMPGGYGTLDELFEALTWLQLDYHRKPVGILNVEGFFDHLIAFLDHARDQRFLRDPHRESLSVDADIDTLIERMRNTDLPDTEKWLDDTARHDLV